MNIVLESIQADGRRRCHVSLLPVRQIGPQRMDQVPRQPGFNVDQVGKCAGLGHFGKQVLAMHVEQLSGGRKGSPVESEIAKNHVVNVHLLGNAIDRGT